MRVLFSCVPGFGHFHPMVPLARALQSAGHEVAFATAERFCRNVVEPAGFRAFAAGLSPLQVQDRLAEQDPSAGRDAEQDPADGRDAEQDPADGRDAEEHPPGDDRQQARFGAAMFAGMAGPAKAGDLTGVIRDWAPGLVVHDAVDFGAPVAAGRAGLPYVGHSFGALEHVEFWERAGASLRPLWAEPAGDHWARGPMFRYLYLDLCPPSLQAPHIADVPVARRMRPVAFDTTGAAELPAWVDRLPPVPTVYVTLGTVFNTTPGLFEAILAALREEPVNVIVTVGLDRDPAELGPQPPNVHVERYLPQSLLFGRCDVVVAHGGSGTLLAALARGLPTLLLPQGANQLGNARRCAELGAGVTLAQAEATPAAIRAGVRGLLRQSSYRVSARRLAREIRRMPDPEEYVAPLEELAAGRARW